MIFVGILFSCLKNKRWRYNQACHLFCDRPESLEELHKLAQQIGLRRSWFQSNSVLPHYDLTASKRSKAIKAGANTASQKVEVKFIQTWRALKKQDGQQTKTT